MAGIRVALSDMVDLALGTPEVGAVNFNVIHTILQTIVVKTGLATLVVEHKGEVPGFEGISPPPDAPPAEEEQQHERSESIVAKLNELLQSNAELTTIVEELNGRVGHLETTAGATPVQDMQEEVETFDALKSQLTNLSLAYNKLMEDKEAGNQNAGFGVGERVVKLENDFQTHNDRLVDLQGTVTGRLTELVKQIEFIEKEMGIINERLNVQSQLHTDTGMDQIDTSQAEQSGHLVTDLYTKVNTIMQDMEHMVETSAQMAEDKEMLDLRFDALKEEVEVLKTMKADKMEIEDVLAGKADLTQVIRKVSHTDFQAKVEEVTQSVDGAFAKLQEHEAEWLVEKERILGTIDSKMDKSEMVPIKDYLMENVQVLIDKVKALAAMRETDDAAGAKKKIIKDLNCISCDKNVIMKQQLDSEDMKAPEGVKAHPSIKPFLTYKLDQVRKQQQKLPVGRNLLHFEEMMQNADPRHKKPPPPSPIVQVDSALHICNRYCGGSHTVTNPLQRVTRTGHFFAEFGSPPPPDSPRAPELAVQEELPVTPVAPSTA